MHHHLFDLPNRPRFDRHWRSAWEGYRAYNRAMADAVCARAGDGDTVLVQDYHFSLLGRMLAERRPDLRTVHFLHTPFAEPSMLAVLPDDVARRAARRHGRLRRLRLPLPQVGGRLRRLLRRGGPRPPRATFVAPLGPDADVLAEEASSPECAAAAAALRAEVGGRRVVARADRMEPSKNIVRGMLAFEELLTAHPEWRGEVVHVAFAYPSRQGLAEYLAYAADVEHTAERINHAFGRRRPTDGPPSCCRSRDDRARSLAALTLSDVLLVNPVRDGLNLVAKEGPLLNTNDGVVVLSREAGAWEELELGGDGALGVNPFDVAGTAEALHAALTDGRRRRARRGPAPCGRPSPRGPPPTGGPTSWRRLRAETPAARAASASARRRATAPVAPATVRSACSATWRGLSVVDRGDPHRVQAVGRRRRQLAEGGEGGQVADVVAERRPRGRGGRPCSAARRAHDRALVDLERRAQLALVTALVHEQAVLGGRPLGEADDPVLVRRGVPPVQRDGQALGLDVDAGGRRGVGLRRRPRR